MPALTRTAHRTVIRTLFAGLASCALAGCAKLQMGYNVLTYDAALADTANQMLLLNAVRASQHYPKSFTSVGQLIASPPVSGSVQSTFNFDTMIPGGLTTYNHNPSISANAGYTQFALGNLNAQVFMEAIRKPVNAKITKAFYANTGWPRELLYLVYVQHFQPSEESVRFVDFTRKARCAAPTTSGQARHCRKIDEHIAEYAALCKTEHFIDINTRMREFRDDPHMYYNTPVNYCHYARFRIFLEEVTFVTPSCISRPQRGPGCPPSQLRSPLDMIGYLGELIAAQNYIDEPFVPLMLYGLSIDHTFDFVDVPIFVVRRGEPLGSAAVVVQHEWVTYYIPRPDFGSPSEERSMQTLDLVLQTVQAATQRDDLPKTLPSFAVISGK